MTRTLHAFALIILTAITIWSPLAAACERYQERADHYSKLRRAGGSAVTMTRWQRQRNESMEQYRECVRNTKPAFQRAQGHAPPPQKPDRQRRRHTQSQDPVVASLLRTCNYWIDTYNSHPTGDNRIQREASCRDLALAEKRELAPATPLVPHTRSLKECAKSGNLLDNDVKECMEGRREPTWR